MTTFSELNLSASLLRALDDAGHETPTPIQAQAIPHLLNGRDLIGIAQTGTGKTAAFALPILAHLEKSRLLESRGHVAPKSCRVLVLSPTRELSGQIVDSFKGYGRHLKPRVELVIGGVPMGRQIRAMSHGVDVLVATPGRLIDLVEQRAVRLDSVEVLVLDEADQMLDMGFIHAIRAIAKLLPSERQTLLFSATMPNAIAELSRQFLSDPVRVSVTPVAKTADKVEQSVIHVKRADKPARLATVLGDPAIEQALVFTRTKHGADKVVRSLDRAGIKAAAIHGNKSQNQRERTLAAFRAGKVSALIATDIAARGLDIPGVSHVVNYDLPNVPEAYVHRIGRTARAGRDGIAIAFCDTEERPLLKAIERLIRMPIPADGAASDHAPIALDTGDRTGDAPKASRPRRPGRRQRRRKSKSDQSQTSANSAPANAGSGNGRPGNARSGNSGSGKPSSRPRTRSSAAPSGAEQGHALSAMPFMRG